MEKPVMYICKLEPRDKEVTIRLTQVTPYKNCRSVEEDRRPESKETKPDEKQETPKEVLDVNKKSTDNPGHSFSEGATVVHDIKKTVLKANTVSSLDENCDQPGQENALQSVSTTASETVIEVPQQKLVSSSDQGSVSTNVKMPWCDPKELNTQETKQSENEEVSINDDIAEAENQPVTCNESEEFTEPTKEEEIVKEKQDSTSAEREENEKIKTESSLVPIASEKATAVSQVDKDCSQDYVERSRTPEIDESIAVEVLSTSLLSGASQYYAPIFLGLQDGVATPPVDVYRDTSAACVYTSGNQQRSVGYGGTSLGNATTSLHEGFNERETNRQSSVSNDDLFLDVESFDADMKENESEAQKFLLKKEQPLKQLKGIINYFICILSCTGLFCYIVSVSSSFLLYF